jgi:hypothetical protein
VNHSSREAESLKIYSPAARPRGVNRKTSDLHNTLSESTPKIFFPFIIIFLSYFLVNKYSITPFPHPPPPKKKYEIFASRFRTRLFQACIPAPKSLRQKSSLELTVAVTINDTLEINIELKFDKTTYVILIQTHAPY